MSPSSRPRASASTTLAVERSAGELSTLAVRRMEENLLWYRNLSAEERSQVGLVAQAGISQFIAWFRQDDQSPSAISIFANAPQELTRTVSLRHTLDLVRTVVDVVESRAPSLAGPGDEQLLRESVLRFSREIAFAAAEVYAGAAEARGAWDARLEALVVDAVLRGEADESMQSRASALGWGEVSHVTFVVGSTPAGRGSTVPAIDELRRAARQHGVEALAIVQRSRLIAIIGGTREVLDVVNAVADSFGPGPIVVGPTVPHLFAAGRSARAALSGLSAAPAWPDAPRIVESEALLPERALAGDPPARRILVDRVHRPLSAAAHAPLLQTATTYLETRRFVGGDRSHPLRARQHGALPPRADQRPHRLRPRHPARSLGRADRPRPGPARRRRPLHRRRQPLPRAPAHAVRWARRWSRMPCRRVGSPTSSRGVSWRIPPKDRA